MLTQFICPDKNKNDITSCLTKCRIPWAFDIERCLPLPTLLAVAEQREWTGKPSTTQLLNGTRESYLRLTTEYAIEPEDMIWAVFGTGVHMVLEKYAPEGFICEERLADEYSTGSPDLYDPTTGILYDYKTYGSYKTAKVMGLYKVKIPICGEDGVQLKYKNGKLMYDEQWKIGHKSRSDLAYQLNDYRTKLELQGHKVNKMVAQILTRDGGTFIATGRGLTKRTETVMVNKISDQWIKAYMRKKSRQLLIALETKECPPPCKKRETWDGLKCSRFCPVWESCDVGRGVHEEK